MMSSYDTAQYKDIAVTGYIPHTVHLIPIYDSFILQLEVVPLNL